MLASIIQPPGDMPDRDFLIFLTNEELGELKSKSIKGEIFEFLDVRKVYPLELILEMEAGNTLHGIGVYFEDNKYKISVVNNLYPGIEENKWYGTRPDDFSKIDIMTEDYAMKDEEYSRDLKSIKARWDNRDKIIENMQREGLRI